MPEKYTFEEVENFFKRKNCQLLTKTYTNQLQKLDYLASCGHPNIMSLKLFLKTNQAKCKNCALEIPSYEILRNEFSKKQCTLCWSSEEFDKKYKNNKTKILRHVVIKILFHIEILNH